MPHARLQPDPAALAYIPFEPCTHAPYRWVIRYPGWRYKQLYRSCPVEVTPGHRRSCDRRFLPKPLGELLMSSRSLTAGLTQRSWTVQNLLAALASSISGAAQLLAFEKEGTNPGFTSMGHASR